METFRVCVVLFRIGEEVAFVGAALLAALSPNSDLLGEGK